MHLVIFPQLSATFRLNVLWERFDLTCELTLTVDTSCPFVLWVDRELRRDVVQATLGCHETVTLWSLNGVLNFSISFFHFCHPNYSDCMHAFKVLKNQIHLKFSFLSYHILTWFRFVVLKILLIIFSIFILHLLVIIRFCDQQFLLEKSQTQ